MKKLGRMSRWQSSVITMIVVVLVSGTFIGQWPQQRLLAQSDNACANDLIVQSGDTLSIIAGRTLGNFAAYNAIITATNAKAADDPTYATITNPNLVAVGWKLCIPTSAGGVSNQNNSRILAATATPTAIPTPITPPTPPPFDFGEDELNPLMIEVMRQQEYPGSKIVIEETLAPGTNYNRYVASYQSEENKIFALLTVPRGTKPATGWPVIIFNHGYIPPAIYRTTERYVAYVDAFARNGYIVLKSDYRGHGF